MRNIFHVLFILLIGGVAQAQISISTGEHNIEISARISTFYNHRFLKEGENDRDKNRFRLRDAQLILEGRLKDEWEYEVQVDFADIGSNISGDVDPENPDLKTRVAKVKALRSEGKPTIPCLLSDELATNPFLRTSSADIRHTLELQNASDIEVFAELRNRRNQY